MPRSRETRERDNGFSARIWMKCHAGIEFTPGKPCPKCGAKLGEVCWPGINADLQELARFRTALNAIIRESSAIMSDPNWNGEAVEAASRFFKIASYAVQSSEKRSKTSARVGE